MKRYSFTKDHSNHLEESPTGEFVRYDDVIKEISFLKRRISDLEMPRRQFIDYNNKSVDTE